ncbi:transcriptional regulator, LacI family [Jatrophihabitans endophyticus]|uniref:Transcriptional regulator, LacI family n=1 Tax=Jatrophihabitans endophyticus TaxID=1206085 RepID=A0A1M5DFY9_9ACTN|nr:LacI family DNA-binding transcriptional regulator [Jatrophihabitans endophyticus]SHF65835.1 transcriptional regulator, LacI family [Jatrophihabitans endophyticus]
MAVSLKDVAALAGVSAKTVSNVVNHRPHVTARTRAAVEEAMAELGYRPNLQARGLRSGRTGLLMLAIPDLTAPYFAELAHLIISTAAEHGFTVLIEETGGEHEREVRALRGAATLLVDGTIISPLALTAADLEGKQGAAPIVLLGERLTGVMADHVAIDNVQAARDATHHLLRRGRRRLAVIGHQDDPHAATAQLRMRGVTEALATSSDATLLPPVAVSGYTWAEGAAAVDVYLGRDPLPDALVCFNDELAIAAMRRAYELGCRVPDDLAVVGIDGVRESEFVTPTLTTITPDKAELARSALASLARRIGRADPPPVRDVVVPHRLVVRESTAAPPSRDPGATISGRRRGR